ncbi:flagellar basal body-associated FliL family protein [Mangrovicella endophytica]|uniref:flagellar basal body-associated FliL family protein n=1 Tax=Mangrovicella endophytica TaxID=2066697 RepID=UPI000C9DE0A0|nr:flagellar basal body-associated FliL family protein [Mangrovicella endophytica]
MTDVNADILAALAGPPKKQSPMPTIIAVVVLTVIAAGGGALMGKMLGSQTAEAPAAAADAKPAGEGAETAAEPAKAKTDAYGGDPEKGPLVILPLQPVITNVYAPNNTYLRLRASVVIRSKETEESPELLAQQIQSDAVVFLRTVQLAQIEGARGLLHLKEDLTERAKMRSPAVVDYIIQELVAE